MQRFTTLAPNQQKALEIQQCPSCGERDSLAKETGRTGETVKCQKCGEKVNRPRGAPVASGKVQSAGGSAESNDESQSGEGENGEGEEKKEQEGGQDQGGMMEGNEGKEKSNTDKIDAQIRKRIKQTVENPHPLLHELIKRVLCGIRNLLLVGPSGSGKSTLAEQLALAFKCPYSYTPWSSGVTEGMLLGRFGADLSFSPSVFVQAIQERSVHNWDDFDAADPNVPLCANSVIANGKLCISDKGKTITYLRHEKSILIATANTWGRGATVMFIGRNQLDAATISRFAGGGIYVDYDTKLEKSLLNSPVYESPDALAFATMFWNIRKVVADSGMRRVWGTRELLAGAKLLRGGYDAPKVLDILSSDWTSDERQQVGLRA